MANAIAMIFDLIVLSSCHLPLTAKVFIPSYSTVHIRWDMNRAGERTSFLANSGGNI